MPTVHYHSLYVLGRSWRRWDGEPQIVSDRPVGLLEIGGRSLFTSWSTFRPNSTGTAAMHIGTLAWQVELHGWDGLCFSSAGTLWIPFDYF
jgi:hypothetical protein